MEGWYALPATTQAMSRVTTLPKWRQVFDVTATLCLLACGVGIWWQVSRHQLSPQLASEAASPSIAVPKEIVRVGHSPVAGTRAAQVAIIEFSEFQCPFCKRFVRDIRGPLFREFVDTGKVLFIFRHLPLDIHKHAVPAAIAAACAHQQGRFWGAHDIIFNGSAQSAAVDVRAQADSLGLNVPAFDNCLTASEPLTTIQADKGEAAKLGIAGTPAFLLGTLTNGEEIQVRVTIAGSKSYHEFRTAIEGLLK